MSAWLSKSDNTFKAANKLIVEELFNASVHCSYYSCVQFMLHILNVNHGMTDNEIDNLNNTTSMTTHKHLKKTFFQSLRQVNADYAIDFNDEIGELCDRRVTADYKSEDIKQKEAEELRQLAYRTISMLKKSY